MEINISSCQSSLQKKTISSASKLDLEQLKGPVHFVGIGGIGMSALARLLLMRGKQVSGSDKKGSEITEELKQLGCDIHIGHAVGNFSTAAAVVVSTAITGDNPELLKAKELGIPILHRSEMLSALTHGTKLVGVSGTHGKTTTTGMVAQLLIDAELDPSVVVGGIFNKIRSNARHGQGGFFVAEVDESDGTQAQVQSYISVITNIENDHLENYPGGLDDIVRSMRSFALNTEKAVVLCADDPRCSSLKNEISPNAFGTAPAPGVLSRSSPPLFITYGSKRKGVDLDYSFQSISTFGIKAYHKGNALGEIKLGVPGEHNKYNAVATLAVGHLLGVEFDTIAESLFSFSGVNRRFQVLGEAKSILVVDDYAHHPTEVAATLKGAREFIDENRNGKGRVVAFFQPHQPSRLQNHWHEFVKCFEHADLVLISDVYVARGKPIDGVNSARFVECVEHENAHYIKGEIGELAYKVIPFLEPNDLVMTIGAGDITSVGPQILDLLNKQS